MIDRFLLGYPFDFQGICWIYPPLWKDVISNNNYYNYVKILTFSYMDMEDLDVNSIEDIDNKFVDDNLELINMFTPLEFLLNNCYFSKEIETVTKQAFEYFIHERVTFLYEQKLIVIGEISDFTSIENLRVLSENNYEDFQNIVRASIGTSPADPSLQNAPMRLRKMKAKARFRDRIKAKKGGLDLGTMTLAICCLGIGITPLNIGEISYCAANGLLAMSQNKEKYSMDIRSLLAGADSKQIHLTYWIHKLDDDE